MKRGVAVGLVLLLGAVALLITVSTRQQNANNPRVPDAHAVLAEAVGLMQAHALEAEALDWPALLAEARSSLLSDAPRRSRLDWALGELVGKLHARDQHSYYLPAYAVQHLTSAQPETAAQIASAETDVDGIPRIALHAFLQLEASTVEQARRQLAGLVEQALQRQPCGLLLDLRSNGGGNMHPMFDGLAALLPPRPLGYHLHQGGQQQAWQLTPRTAEPVAAAIAVLIGPGTASSGEFVAIGLRALPRTRSFGAASAGLTTANQLFPLRHGGSLALTVAQVADHQQQRIQGRLLPDEAHEEPLAPAARWVRAQCESVPMKPASA